MLNKFKLYILIWMIPYCSCAWVKPFFEDAKTKGVMFGDFSDTEYVQTIAVDEELEVPFTIAIMNYDGTTSPFIDSFNAGSNSELGLNFTQVNNRWHININRVQDYELIMERVYYFVIQVVVNDPDPIKPSIQLFIKNLIDEDPIVQYNGPCTTDELQKIGAITDCVFDVFVPDGMVYSIPPYVGEGWTNTITPSVNSLEEDLFEFEEQPSNNDFNRQFKLKLKTMLHYEVKPFFNFRSYFTDKEGNTGEVLTILELNDLPNQPPKWIQPFTIEEFDELTPKEFPIEATDGDTGLNHPIQFYIRFDPADEERKHLKIQLTSVNNKKTIVTKYI